MTQPVVLLDANVFPTTWLLDILLTLDEHEIVDVVWSERILDEASSNGRTPASRS